jgi:YfiH family protein
LPVLRVPSWQRIPHLEHGFFGRRGGRSAGPYSSLNLSYSVGDSVEAVDDNWERVRARAGVASGFATMKQVHGAQFARVDSAGAFGEADAMTTSVTGVGLCILTADCVPALFVAPSSRAVAAIHAGWRGTLAGIAVDALQALATAYGTAAGDVYVALGPAIGPCCYEVDGGIADDLAKRWRSAEVAIRRYTRNGQAKAQLDLRRANAAMLIESGVAAERISLVGGCTCCESVEFFSYRRAADSANVTGRQLSFIGWSG